MRSMSLVRRGRHRLGHRFCRSGLLSLLVMAPLTMAGCDSPSLTDAEFVMRAQEHWEKGELRLANIELKNALQENPENAEARLLLGELYVEVGDGAAAQKELRRAIELGVGDDRVLLPLAKALLLQGKVETLMEIAVSDGLPADTRAAVHAQRVRGHLMQGNLEAAKAELQLAITAKEDSEAVWLARAYVAAESGELNEANEWLEKVFEVSPRSREAFVLSGRVAIAEGDYPKAQSVFEAAVAAHPDEPVFLTFLAASQIANAQLEQAVATSDSVLKIAPDDPTSNFLRAVAAYQLEDYARAQLHAENALLGVPGHLPSHLIAGAARYHTGGFEQARAHLRVVVASAPSYDPAVKLLAAAELRSGSAGDALGTLASDVSFSQQDAGLLAAIGTAALHAGDVDAAGRALERAANLQPEDASARARLGLARIAAGDTGEGVEELEKAVELDPELQMAEVALIMELLRAGQHDQALERARTFQQTYPEQAVGYALEGVAHMGKREEAEAKAAFNKALELEPGEPTATHNLVAFALRDGDTDTARELLEDLLAQNPNHVPTLIRLADMDVAAGEPDQAIARLQAAVESAPDALEPRILLGRTYLRANRPTDALDLLGGEVLRNNPGNPAVLETVGRAQLQAGEPDQATTTFRTLAEVAPKATVAHIYLARALEQAGDLRGALGALDAALALDPKSPAARFARARLLARTGELAAAAEAMDALRAEYPENIQGLELEGNIALAQGDAEKAIAKFQAALDVTETSALTIQLAGAQWRAGKVDEGFETLQEWLQRYPEDLYTRGVYADGLLATNNVADAQQQYETIVERMPEHVPALNNLAWLNLQAGRVDAALDYSERAIALAPDNAGVMDTRAMALLEQGRVEDAHRLLREAARRAPDNPSIQFHLAQAAIQAGNNSEARDILETLVSAEPPVANQAEARALLSTIGE